MQVLGLWNLALLSRQADPSYEFQCDDADLQDCLYGMEKAMTDGLLDLAEFDIKHYRWFEQVE